MLKSKPMEKLCAVREDDMPGWFEDGVHAAVLAPTALNQQKFILDIDGEACCSCSSCKDAQKDQQEKIYRESTKEYADIKRSYDAYVRRYKSYLVTARIDTLYPDKFDEFMQAKEERQTEMSRLKRRLINYGLPSEELYELGEKFKREIRVIAERIIKCE